MLRRLDDICFAAGQITPEQVPALKAAGVTTIVNNRPDGEEPGQPLATEIEAAARDAGIAYRAVPISRGIGPAEVEATRAAIEAAADKVLLFCRSGARSTLVWALARRAQGASVEEIEKGAESAGVSLEPIRHLL